MADMMIGYVLLFLFIALISFHFGREWERVDQEDQKKRDPIKRVPGRWE